MDEVEGEDFGLWTGQENRRRHDMKLSDGRIITETPLGLDPGGVLLSRYRIHFHYTRTTKNAGDLWIFTEIYVKMNSLEHFQ